MWEISDQDLSGLEWVVCEEDHAPQRPGQNDTYLNNWHTSLVRKAVSSGVVWRRDHEFANDSHREPQQLAVGNFDTTRSFAEVWARSRFPSDADVTLSQHPWIFDAYGVQFSDYATEDSLPAGFNNHADGNMRGIEMVWTIDWKGSKKEHICAAARDGDAVGVFDALTGKAVWNSQDVFPRSRPTPCTWRRELLTQGW